MHWTPEPKPTAPPTRTDRPARGPRAVDAGRSTAPRELLGSLLGLVIGSGALLLLTTLARQASELVPGAARADDVLMMLLAWIGVVLAVWLTLGSLLAALALLPGSAGRLAAEVADRITPLAVRRTLTFVLGAAVGSCALPAAPVSGAVCLPVSTGRSAPGATPEGASAATTPGYVPTSAADRDRAAGAAESSGARLADGPGFLPTIAAGSSATGSREESGPVPAPTPLRSPGYLPTAPAPVHQADRPRLLAPAPRLAVSTHDRVTVHRGDSLWSVAARHLGPGASDAQVAHEWPRWYAANRTLIGDDPDVLVPGQQLQPPAATTAAADAAAAVAAARGARR